jgi:hypothetical protein
MGGTFFGMGGTLVLLIISKFAAIFRMTFTYESFSSHHDLRCWIDYVSPFRFVRSLPAYHRQKKSEHHPPNQRKRALVERIGKKPNREKNHGTSSAVESGDMDVQ